MKSKDFMDNRITADEENYKAGAMLYRNQVKRLFKLMPPPEEHPLPAEFKDFFNTLYAIFNYAYTGQKMNISKLSEDAQDVFNDFESTLKSSRTHAKNKGGRDRNKSQRPPQPNNDITPEMSNEF